MKSVRSYAFRIMCIASAAVMIFMSTFALFGCSFLLRNIEAPYVDFTQSTLAMQVGDIYAADDIIVTNATKYTLTSSDPDTVEISDGNIKALAVGYSTVTASTTGGYTSTLSVRVSQKEEDSLTISTVGDLIQTVGATSEVVFEAITTGSVANYGLEWYINDVKSVGETSSKFSYTPTQAGLYTVTVKSSGYDLVATEILRVYNAVSASANYDGELVQNTEPYTGILFSVSVSSDRDNPDDYIQWYVNEELVLSGNEYTFMYVPTPGENKISVKVNGVIRKFGDDDYVSVRCKGAVAPVSAPEIIFDNVYPHVYITYSVIGSAQIEITSPEGTVSTFAQTDEQYKDLFDGVSFDAGRYITLCAQSQSRKSYRIRVKSLGDGDLLSESGYSPYLTFMQLPQNAQAYWQNRYLDADHYITSIEEYVGLFEYEVIFRSKTTTRPAVDFDCYLAYDPEGGAEGMWDDAFPIAATSGRYTNIDVSITNKILHTSFTVNTVNNPSRQTYGNYGSDYAKQLHAILPHINYDENKYRSEDYVFPIDKLENTMQVEYTDELYLTSEHNTRPVPKSGSSAETVYNMARSALRKICTDDMTDAQKAHAIYDWIMWQVTYDTPATESNISGESYSAYYLEGVFGDGKTAIDGVVYYPYAVCDGMSKAYSLLCNIEGIPCVRVAGTAGESLAESGGHAWNKVCIDGSWYVVDCTWGDAQGEFTFNGQTDEYELGSHDYLFLTDSQADPTHFEPYEAGESSVIYAPQTTDVKYSVYKNMEYNGAVIDCLIAVNENISERAKQIATQFANAYVKRTSIYVPGGPNNGIYSIDYEGIEFHVDGNRLVTEKTITGPVRNAIRAIYPNADIQVNVYDNTVLILMRA